MIDIRYQVHGLTSDGRLAGGPGYSDIIATSFEEAAAEWLRIHSIADDGRRIRIMHDGEYEDFKVRAVVQRSILKVQR